MKETASLDFIKRLLRSGVVLILILMLAFSAAGQRVQNFYSNKGVVADFENGFSLVSNFSFIDAQMVADKSRNTYPSSSWPHLLQAEIYWWQIISGESNSSRFNEFHKELDLARQKAGNTYEGLFCLIMANTYRTRLELLINGNSMAAVVHLKTYYQSVRKSLGSEELFEPFYITSGLYYYLAWVAWNDYPLLRPFLFFLDKGNKSLGLKYLGQAALSNDPVISTQAVYFLMRIFHELEKDKEVALKYATLLIRKYPGNFVFLHYYLQCLPGELQPKEKEALIEKVVKNAQLTDRQKLYFYKLLQI